MRLRQALHILLLATVAGVAIPAPVSHTTELARKSVLEKIEAITAASSCRLDFDREKIDLERVRATVNKVWFYDAEGADGRLRFSQVAGRPASPDQRLRDLAREVGADAFVLGYQDGSRYVRLKDVILNQGYFRQANPREGTWRPTTEDEKQALLLHEVLHIALDRDDDDLNRLGLCPLRLLAACT